MNPGRTILAILAGYLCLILLEIAGGAMLAAVSGGRAGSTAIIGGEVVVLIAGLIAGALTARLAPMRPLSHASALALSIVSVTFVATALVKAPPHQLFPPWYPYATALLAGCGAFFGGALARR